MSKHLKKVLIVILTTVTLLNLFCACGKKTTYAITFDSLGGTAIDSQTVKEGKLVSKPADPTKEGFTFVEWQFENSTYNFDKPVTKDLTLTAYYTINEGTEIVLVMLDYQNGQEMGIIEIAKGGTTGEPPKPQKKGYKFLGWYLNNDKFDFSSNIDENVALTAKWEIDKSDLDTNSMSINSSISSNIDITDTDFSQSNADNNVKTKYDSTVSKYTGRWYLYGYADVCIDVFRHEYVDTTALNISTYNFGIALSGKNGVTLDLKYVVYPDKIDNVIGWSAGITISYSDWNNDLAKEKVILGNNCIYINNNKFVKEQGTKDKYYDTCYKEALGTWYLDKNPNSIIEIYTKRKASDIENSDYFAIRTTNFSISTLNTINSGEQGGGYADKKSAWDDLGISIENDALIVSNSKGSKTFYRTKTEQEVTGIKLNTTKVSIGSIGSTYTLVANVLPDNAKEKGVVWTSSNSSVATVSSSGIVTAINKGTTTITVKTKEGNFSSTCVVTVTESDVKGVSVNKSTLNMTVGGIEQLSASITPSSATNQKVTWSSSNNSIAQVSSNGKVTAIGIGEATITVKTEEGGYTAKCKVTVAEPKITVSASIGVGYYMSGSASVQGVFAKAIPSGGSGDYVVYSIKLYYNGTLVAEGTKNEVIITPVKSGTYKAEVYVKDSNGNEATTTHTTTISY